MSQPADPTGGTYTTLPQVSVARPYVYAVMVDGVVRYIGKGRKGRRLEHIKRARYINRDRALGKKVKGTVFYNKLAKALREGAKVTTKVLRYYASDEAAFAGEIWQIANRKGLWNTAEGGQGGMTSKQARAILANLKTTGRWEQIRLVHSQASKALWDNPERRAKLLAIRATPEVKAKKAASTADWYKSKRMRKIAVRNGKNSDKALLWEGRNKFYAEGGGAVIAASNRRRLKDPEWRERNKQILAEARKRNNADPVFQAKRKAGVEAYWERRRNGVTS